MHHVWLTRPISSVGDQVCPRYAADTSARRPDSLSTTGGRHPPSQVQGGRSSGFPNGDEGGVGQADALDCLVLGGPLADGQAPADGPWNDPHLIVEVGVAARGTATDRAAKWPTPAWPPGYEPCTRNRTAPTDPRGSPPSPARRAVRWSTTNSSPGSCAHPGSTPPPPGATSPAGRAGPHSVRQDHRLRFPSRDFAANAVRLELSLAPIDLPAWSGGLLLDGKPATAHTKNKGCGAKSRVSGLSRPCATGSSSPRFGRSGPGRLHLSSDCLSDPGARSRAARSRRRAVVPLRCARRRPCLASRPLATVMTILFGGAVMPVDVWGA